MTPISDLVAVAPSPIHGHGCYARCHLAPDTPLGVARVIVDPGPLEPSTTTAFPLGKLMNHSTDPNVAVRVERSSVVEFWHVYTLCDVGAGVELTVRYPGWRSDK